MLRQPRLRVGANRGAPPWREVFVQLGLSDTDPRLDGRNAARIGSQTAKRTPGQLLAVVASLARSFARFDPWLDLACTCRQSAIGLSVRESVRLRELFRFLSVAREILQAVERRRNHPLDNPAACHDLYLAAAALSRRLDRHHGTYEWLQRLDSQPTQRAANLPGRPALRRRRVWPTALLVSAGLVGLAAVGWWLASLAA